MQNKTVGRRAPLCFLSVDHSHREHCKWTYTYFWDENIYRVHVCYQAQWHESLWPQCPAQSELNPGPFQLLVCSCHVPSSCLTLEVTTVQKFLPIILWYLKNSIFITPLFFCLPSELYMEWYIIGSCLDFKFLTRMCGSHFKEENVCMLIIFNKYCRYLIYKKYILRVNVVRVRFAFSFHTYYILISKRWLEHMN